MLRAARHDRTCANMPPVAALEHAPPTLGALEPHMGSTQRTLREETRARMSLATWPREEERSPAYGLVGRVGEMSTLSTEHVEHASTLPMQHVADAPPQPPMRAEHVADARRRARVITSLSPPSGRSWAARLRIGTG